MRLIPSVIALALIFPAAAAEVRAAPPDPVWLLQKALSQADRVPFSGRRVTIVWTDNGSEATITWEFHSGDGRTRVETSMPNRARGRVVLTDRGSRWEYDPARKTVRRSAVSESADGLADLNLLLGSYRVTVAPRAETLASRRVWRVDVTPRTGGKPHRRLWIDGETGLIVKIEKFHADGQPISNSSFTELRLERPAESLFAPRFPPGTRYVPHLDGSHPIERASVEARFNIRIPEHLADGYRFEGARLIHARGKSAAHLRYSDGLSTLSWFVGPHGGAVPYGSGSGRKIALQGGEGRLVTEHHIAILTWRTPRVDCALVGDTGEDLLRRLAASTRLTEGAQESHHAAFPPGLWLAPALLLAAAGGLAIARRIGSRARVPVGAVTPLPPNNKPPLPRRPGAHEACDDR